ncbi:hypothetical protein PK98_08455 [Croceibacterium mercuriale]|uniref:Uncharacterized protein n=1 Tax=Croceibacterium mercuriale TaxID=1572751 RepID=A0A0B2C2F6_9SPHN|nr:hypothetical protein PK98_08455 [Croceibacterium mercuriale]
MPAHHDRADALEATQTGAVLRNLTIAVGILAGAVALTGCATMAQNEARSDAVAQCAARGMRFLEQSATAREGLIISTGSVSGECIGADDPRWAQGIAGTENSAPSRKD